MKRLFLTLMGALLLSGSAMAQKWADQNYGVRTGFTISNANIENLSTDPRLGFHVGGFYEHKISSTLPLYVEAALSIGQKGTKFEYPGLTMKANLWYMEIPVSVNYKFQLSDEMTIYPSAGLYYALGLGGKIKGTDEGFSFKDDAFGDEALSRSDFGIQLGGVLDWKRYQFGINYSVGLVDIANSNSFPEISTWAIKFSVGYRF